MTATPASRLAHLAAAAALGLALAACSAASNQASSARERSSALDTRRCAGEPWTR